MKNWKVYGTLMLSMGLLLAEPLSVFAEPGEGTETTETITQTEHNMEEQKQYEPQLTPLESVDYEFEKAETAVQGTLPEAYDSRTYGYVTDVKNQGKWGTCWSFSEMAIAESSALRKGISTNPDYSELHNAYFYYYRENDPLGGTANDKNTLGGSKSYLETGGNNLLNAQALATWSGIADETVAPYLPYDEPEDLSPAVAYDDTVILKNAYFLSDDRDEIKNAIMTYGAVAIMYYHDDDYYNYKTAAYSDPCIDRVNHAVAVVGWDDNYSASNFEAASEVTGNGAWIVKNSWSERWGDDGYFYISYEDASVTNPIVIDVVDAAAYDYNYQYDGTGYYYRKTLNSGDSIANVFTIQDNGVTTGQELTAVQFTTYSANVDYSIQIYTDMTEEGNPYSGVARLETPQEGKTGSGGIHTVDLKTPVFLKNGEKYAVVVTFSKDDGYVMVGVEESRDCGWVVINAGIDAGQSYVYRTRNETWSDLSQEDQCARIKAFTKQSNQQPVAPQNVKASAEKENIKVTWDEVDSADGYVVYRKAEGESKYSYKGMITSNSTTTYTDTNVTKGTKYSYMIYSYYNYADGKMMLSSTKTSSSVVAGLSPVSNLKAASAGKGKVKLTWSAATNADGYIIYGKKAGEEKFTYLYIVGSDRLSYTDLKASGTEYNFYRVYPYMMVNGKRVVGPSEQYVYAKGIPTAVTNLKASSVTGGVKLTWGKVTDADGYLVYGRHGSNGTYSYIGMTSSTSYSDKKALTSDYNFYWVTPYFKDANGTIIPGLTANYVYGKAK